MVLGNKKVFFSEGGGGLKLVQNGDFHLHGHIGTEDEANDHVFKETATTYPLSKAHLKYGFPF